VFDWCQNKNWLIRLPFLIWFAYIFVRSLQDPMYGSVLSWLNLGIHELGHVVLMPFGLFIHVLGGTLFQLAAPIFSLFNFYRQDDYFSICLSFGWLSTSLFDTARYVSDARSLNLPLATIFGNDNPIHDWNYLLDKLHLLPFDLGISIFVKVLASIAMLTCLISGGWLLYLMANKPKIDEIRN